MKKMKISFISFFLVISFSFFSFVPPARCSRITLDSDQMLRYALVLIEEGDYDVALGELKRFLHFFPQEQEIPLVKYYTGICYMEKGDNEKARKIFLELARVYNDPLIRSGAFYFSGETCYRQGAFREAEYYYSKALMARPQGQIRRASLYRLGWARMKQDKWNAASEAFRGIEGDDKLAEMAGSLAEASLEGKILMQKAPAGAAVLAAVIPGLGHAYVKRYRDAGISFLLNGLFIWASIESFRRDHDVLGGMLSFLELGWYSGNIYSAVNVTHKYNRKIREQYRFSLKEGLKIRIIKGDRGPAGIGFSIDF